MAEETGIAWTRSTFNGWVGCQKIGPGCDNCYAEAQDRRWGNDRWGPHAIRTRTSPAYWRKPFGWNAHAAASGQFWPVFCSSLADVFDNAVPQAWRDDLWALIRATPHLTWQLVTKRIGNAARMLPADWGEGYPNVWLLSTIVTQNEADRDIPKLLCTPARTRGLSMEPLLEAVTLTALSNTAGLAEGQPYLNALGGYAWAADPPDYYDTCTVGGKLDWIIVGGESMQGGACRPFDLAWARALRGECYDANVAFFMKQTGSLVFDHERPISRSRGPGADPAKWEHWLRVRQFPDAAGRPWEPVPGSWQRPAPLVREERARST
ncbi:MAG: DUF5131 family protein [Gemmatimonadaceae bacterium]|nr:DUF5131 family protein [Gemmatimonadaceae bacterium]